MRLRTLVIALVVCSAPISVVDAQKKRIGKRSSNPCQNAMSQTDMNRCACDEFAKADAELNRVYQKILSARAGDAMALEKIKAGQRAWILFRDAQLEALYPVNGNPRVTCGSVHPMCYCAAEQALTVARTKQLKEMMEAREGDVCG